MPTPWLPDDLRDKYDHGCCMYLAIALHEATGLPIEAAVSEGFIAHAWVVDGAFAIDAIGRYDVSDPRTTFGGVVHQLSVAQLEALMPGGPEAHELSAARDVVAKYYRREPEQRLFGSRAADAMLTPCQN